MTKSKFTKETVRAMGRVTVTETVSTGFGDRTTVWSTTDNLDTKSLEQTSNNYEEVFVRIRNLLSEKPWCCDSKEDVLSMCQIIADDLRSNLLIRRAEND